MEISKLAGSSNPIWNYFRRNERTATCVVCMKELSLGSDMPKNQTVSSIKKHLEKVHQNEYAAFHNMEVEYVLNKSQRVNLARRAKRKRLKEQKEAVEGPKEKKKPGRKRKMDRYSESEDIDPIITKIEIMDPLIDHERPMDTMRTDSNEHIQLAVHEHKRLVVKPSDIAVSRRIDRSILELMVVDMLPCSIVQGEAFKKLNISDPYRPSKYVLKTADFYKNHLIPETFEAVKSKVMFNLEQAEWVSLTTTDWEHPTKSCFIQAVSAHYLFENQKHMVVLQMSPRQSNSASTPPLLELTQKYNIVDKVHLSIVNESDDMSSEWFTVMQCSAYMLEKVLMQSLLCGDNIEILKRKCHSIIDHFENNPQSVLNLHECQEICGLPQQKLVVDSQENWTSAFLMWDRLVEQKSALELYIQQYGDLEVPSTYEWNTLSNITSLLKVLYQAWVDLNSDGACISLIIPLLRMLNSKFEPKLNDSQDLLHMKSSLKSQLNQHFAFVHQTSFLIIATLLDPRFKMLYLTENQLSSCHAEMTHNLRISLNIEEESNVKPSFNTLPTNQYKFHNTSDLWETHDTSTISEGNSKESVFLAFEQQLNFYLKEPLIARNSNIYQYWNITPYEYLRKLAYKYLTAPPTSLYCNDVINNAGMIYAERRLASGSADDENLLFMSSNIKLFNFNY